MGDASIGEQSHLLLGGSHKQETTCVEQKDGQELEAVGVFSIVADSIRIAQDEADLNYSCKTSAHESVTEYAVDHRAEWKTLRVCAHGPASHEDDNARDEIALRAAATVSTEPDSDQSSTPPDDSHTGVLQVVVYPRSTPSVLGESIDTSPGSDDQAVKELLRPVGPLQPDLADQ